MKFPSNSCCTAWLGMMGPALAAIGFFWPVSQSAGAAPEPGTPRPIRAVLGPIIPEDQTPASPSELPMAGMPELSVDVLVQQVLARNPSLAQMTAAWQAASARYPQVTSLDDPMFGTTLAPGSWGSNDVEVGYRVEVAQKYPWPGKRRLRGEAARA